jgi:hypothetical protein
MTVQPHQPSGFILAAVVALLAAISLTGCGAATTVALARRTTSTGASGLPQSSTTPPDRTRQRTTARFG